MKKSIHIFVVMKKWVGEPTLNIFREFVEILVQKSLNYCIQDQQIVHAE